MDLIMGLISKQVSLVQSRGRSGPEIGLRLMLSGNSSPPGVTACPGWYMSQIATVHTVLHAAGRAPRA